MATSGDDTVGALDALLDVLAGERCAFVVDDAHHAAPDAARLLGRMAARLQAEQHLVVLARRLPEGAERLRRGDWLPLGAADLALRPDETLALCRHGFGLDVGPVESGLLDRATGGWTAAAVLAAARVRRTGSRPRTAGTPPRSSSGPG